MICLDKLQKVIARELKIPLDTLPNIHDSLRNAGFSEIKKGNEIISLEVKHNEIKEHEKIESKQDLERVKESQKEAIKLQQELKTAEKARKEAFKAVEQTAQKINNMVESEDSALFQELEVGNGHIRSYALAKHINPQQYPNIKEIAELIETLKQQNTHFKETWKAAQDKEIQYEEAYRNFLAQHINTYMNKKIPYDRDFRTENINTIAYKLRVVPDHYGKTIIQESRELIENTLNIKPLKEFGTNYAEYYRDGYHAVNKVLRERSGQVAGAFYKEGLGDIDLVWGEVTGKGKEAQGYGLAKIIEKHGDEFEALGGVAKVLSEIIENGEVVKRKGREEAYNIEYKGFIVGINKGFNKQGGNKWIVTAFDNNKSIQEKTAKTARTNDLTKEVSNLSLNSSIDSTTNKAIKQEATQTQSRSWQIQGAPEIISPEEVDSFVKALGKNHIASHITNMDRETATKLAPYIQQFHSINNGARNYLVEHWDTIKQAYKDGKVSKKEFQFLSRYGKKDALINRITNLIQHYIKPIMENYLYEIDERGIKTYKPQNFYNNYIASPTQKNVYGNEISENIMRLVTNKIAEAKKYLDKHIYYVEKAQKQAEAIVKKQEAMLHDDYDLLPVDKDSTREIEKAEIYKQREATKEILSHLIGKEIVNQNDGRVATISKKNIAKMTSDKAMQKSLDNGFSELEHFKAVQDIENLYQKAVFKETHEDLKGGSDNVLIHRYNAELDNANALITLKETLSGQYEGNRIYSLELEALELKLSSPEPQGDKSVSRNTIREAIVTPTDLPNKSIAQNQSQS